jgi:hypothetical protein
MWTFDPTANLSDFNDVPGLRAAWSSMLDSSYDQNINGTAGWDPNKPLSDTNPAPFAVEELQAWGRTASDLRFYNPTHIAVPSGSSPVNVNWNALPTSFNAMLGGDTTKVLTFLDSPQTFKGLPGKTRIQDEYCEWVVTRDAQNRISKVVFTSEPPEYYDFLFAPPAGIDPTASQALLVSVYQHLVGDPSIRLSDLLDANGQYDHWNKWNNQGCVHMQQPNNTLGAEINIAARSAILRTSKQGSILKDAGQLIQCGLYGEPTRQSDPTIGAAVNAVARDNKFITLQNPVGLYMAALDTTGWATPDGTDPQSFWKVVRGSSVGDASQNMIVRAEFSVPSSKSYAVSDITIGGTPIQFGGQIAANIQMRLGVLVGPVGSVPAPRAIGCLGVKPTSTAPAPLPTRRR